MFFVVMITAYFLLIVCVDMIVFLIDKVLRNSINVIIKFYNFKIVNINSIFYYYAIRLFRTYDVNNK